MATADLGPSSAGRVQAPPLFTFGHGTASQTLIAALLHGADVDAVVDVRTVPGSRRVPHVGRHELSAWLPGEGIGYRWERRLGGFRRPSPDSPDTFWRNDSFRGYAGYSRGPEFHAALKELLGQAAASRTAIMCSETVWWRCHRRIIADYAVLVHAVPVLHLAHDGRLGEHRPTAGARLLDGGLLVYDAP
ncbi:DUF488 domain-containing protein [Nonomuraea pusilla]|uniref:DUF488 domain-containing protein n=1 Tax=Nonomuraea pusilla TaxID=46177 RepID=UPI00331EEB02